MKMYFIKKHKQKNKLAIGGGGNSKKILIINLSEDEYINFNNFCNENNYEFKILSIEKEYVVSCVKNVYLLFKGESIKNQNSPMANYSEHKKASAEAEA